MRPVFALLPVLVSLLSACQRDDGNTVRLYCALDEEHARQLVRQFEQETGIAVDANFDTEANKTVGLVTTIMEEAYRPRCDVFWNNELAQTVRLGQKGLLQPYDSPSAADIPDRYKDDRHLWNGFAARARILIVNTELIPDPADYPTSMWDLIDPKWKGKCAVARPLTGTALTHFAALALVLDDSEFQRFLDGLRENDVKILQSNGATMKEVATGDLAFAFTDTDDYHVALTKGHPVTAVFPDQGEDQIGTMLIPNSVAIVKDAPHPKLARELVDWILTRDTEAKLAAGKSAQIPVRPSVPGPPAKSILPIGRFKAMDWDPEATAAAMDEMSARFAERFGS